MKYYAVKIGRKPGVYAAWPECEAQVKGFPGAKYKSFPFLADAEAFAAGAESPAPPAEAPEPPYAFVDGSYNKNTSTAGWGGFLVMPDGTEIPISGSESDPEWASMRNVAGEVLGCTEAVARAMAAGLPGLTVYYDYAGIEQWATGGWEARNPMTRKYADYMKKVIRGGFALVFKKVAAHTGIPGNERADAMAKRACGVKA